MTEEPTYSISYSSDDAIPKKQVDAYVKASIDKHLKDLKKDVKLYVKHVNEITKENKRLIRICEKLVGKVK